MASSLLKLTRLPRKTSSWRLFSDSFHDAKVECRDVVSISLNSEPHFTEDFPVQDVHPPRISTLDIWALKAKEKGDWKLLSLEEKKTLYRASFSQTFSEMSTPTGEWKPILAGTFAAMGLMIWSFIWMSQYVHSGMSKTSVPAENNIEHPEIITYFVSDEELNSSDNWNTRH